MTRPDDERQVAAEWVQVKRVVSPERLGPKHRGV